MNNLIRYITFSGEDKENESNKLLYNEWLLTNALGGYSSLSIGGANTRKYHGLLVASLPAPLGRVVTVSTLIESILLPTGEEAYLSQEEYANDKKPYWDYIPYIKKFSLVNGLPVWFYQIDDIVIEKTVLLLNRQNTIQVTYKVLQASSPIHFKCNPLFSFRFHEASVKQQPERYELSLSDSQYEIRAESFAPLRFCNASKAQFVYEHQSIENVFYRIESERGYDSVGNLTSVGYFELELNSGQQTTFIFSTESWEVLRAVGPKEASEAEVVRRQRLLKNAQRVHPDLTKSLLALELVLAADQFIIVPITRIADIAYTRAYGDEARTIIAGYHWFTDWGRDTMISLEGLTLVTGRIEEAGCILRTFAHYIKDGLIPNMFPEGKKEGIYHTVDATLWFFHAIDRYLAVSQDQDTLNFILPKLIEVVNFHLKGTHFNIVIDPADGLLKQGAEGYALTWMDAKVGDLVVTPRRGKAVEINALWYNALCLLCEWLEQLNEKEAVALFRKHADQCYRSFNERFWYEEGEYLYDIIDGERGNDAACRPNQILAISLKYPVLEPSRWKTVLEKVKDKLLTPLGLRSLAPDHPDYKINYNGDLFTRDSAYHQGTVWAWLIGPFIDAWLKVYPDDLEKARAYLVDFEKHILHSCVGSVNEIFDAEHPYTPRGCVAQAWSVAEVLRCWQKTER
jgi:predicted glycogen debranching enzyme